MRRMALWAMYDGTQFSGYQVQPGKRTVQSEIERALATLHKGTEIRIHSSGRTDTGVHARGQVIHFDTTLQIPVERWPKAINSCLADDVRIIEAAVVPDDFHSRYDAIQKEYHYRVLIEQKPDVWKRNTTYHFPFPLNYPKMEEAASLLMGTHDFSSFCASNTSVKDKVRTLSRVSVELVGDELVFKLVGNGFLYNMVRIIVGTLLEVGIEKREPSSMSYILQKKDRSLAGKTAPGNGLFLRKVYYNNDIFSENY